MLPPEREKDEDYPMGQRKIVAEVLAGQRSFVQADGDDVVTGRLEELEHPNVDDS